MHLSTGNLLRDAIAKGTDLGKQADKVMKKGELVSDEIIIDLMKEEIKNSDAKKKGLLLDGFPRTVEQAEKLDMMMKDFGMNVNKVIELKTDDKILSERITGRRLHEASGRSYHVKFNPPKVEGKDDQTGEPLIQRADDTEEALMKRLVGYHT